MSDIRAIAFYLPQFHPFKENDEWWGKGFTEWTNVTATRPLFKGHYQPHLPSDLGFYDLRLAESRQAQADLAREYGVHGFCYYHYWFNGRRLLERPFNEVLASGKPELPFCLCWANENWSRRWDGNDREILMPQAYSEEDDIRHMAWLANAFKDDRYIRVEGKPLFLIYRLGDIPKPENTIATMRREARKLGIGEIYLCNVESMNSEHGLAAKLDLDAAIQFAPDWSALPPRLGVSKPERLKYKLGLGERAYSDHFVRDYSAVAKTMLALPEPGYKILPGVTPMWDNAARRKAGAFILRDSTPEAYRHWLSTVVERLKQKPAKDQIVFINAWNEWAEGNHLEPCRKWKRAYLEATRAALNGA